MQLRPTAHPLQNIAPFVSAPTLKTTKPRHGLRQRINPQRFLPFLCPKAADNTALHCASCASGQCVSTTNCCADTLQCAALMPFCWKVGLTAAAYQPTGDGKVVCVAKLSDLAVTECALGSVCLG